MRNNILHFCNILCQNSFTKKYFWSVTSLNVFCINGFKRFFSNFNKIELDSWQQNGHQYPNLGKKIKFTYFFKKTSNKWQKSRNESWKWVNCTIFQSVHPKNKLNLNDKVSILGVDSSIVLCPLASRLWASVALDGDDELVRLERLHVVQVVARRLGWKKLQYAILIQYLSFIWYTILIQYLIFVWYIILFQYLIFVQFTILFQYLIFV